MLDKTHPNEIQLSKAREMNKHIARMLQAVSSWSDAHTVPVDYEMLPSKVRAEIVGWKHAFFNDSCPSARPDTHFRVILGIDDSDDVVLYDFTLGNLRGTAYETKGQLALLASSVLGEARNADELHSVLQTFSETCLAAKLSWSMRPRCEVEGPFALSSSPYQTIWTAPFWHSRIDAGTLGSRIFLLLYKRINQEFGLAGGEWFDDEFRARVKALAAARK